MIQSFDYTTPHTIDEYISIGNTDSILLAGGSDLIPLLKFEVKNPKVVIDIQNILELKKVSLKDGILEIGAGVRLCELENNSEIQQFFPALAYAAKCVASPQIRSVATIGGNIMQDRRCMYFNQSYNWRQSVGLCYKTNGKVCHQAPASKKCRAIYYSDIATALYIYNTRVEIIRHGNFEEISIQELCEAHGSINGTASKSEIFISKFLLPISEKTHSRFIKESVRQSIDFSTFNAAISILKKNDKLDIKLAVGAINEHPILIIEMSR